MSERLTLYASLDTVVCRCFKGPFFSFHDESVRFVVSPPPRARAPHLDHVHPALPRVLRPAW